MYTHLGAFRTLVEDTRLLSEVWQPINYTAPFSVYLDMMSFTFCICALMVKVTSCSIAFCCARASFADSKVEACAVHVCRLRVIMVCTFRPMRNRSVHYTPSGKKKLSVGREQYQQEGEGA